MRIILDNKEAALKEGTSFDYVAENRSFTGADGYSLAITFPLKGCPQNMDIFGHIARADVDKSKVVYDCEIHDVNFSLYGTMTIVEVTDTEVKAQFLEGRSVQNYDNTFDDIYINALDLGSYPSSTLPADPRTAWQGRDAGVIAVALPWVNNTSGNIQNEVVYNNSAYSYADDCKGLSYQPYLLDITYRICEAVGYECDLSAWENSEHLPYLLICNALPFAWDMPGFARALPQWTVTEFFEKLEQFLCGEFDIDHKAKRIVFSFTAELLAKCEGVSIEKVVDEYTTEISTEDESNYIEMANVSYKECSHKLWGYYSCRWFIEDWRSNALEYDTLTELINTYKKYRRTQNYPRRNSTANKLFYARDVDTFFVLRSIGTELVETDLQGYNVYNQKVVLQPVNVFGDRIEDEDSGNDIELELVPAWIDETEESKGNCLFLEPGSYSEDTDTDTVDESDKDYRNRIIQPASASTIEAGEKDKKAEYYDCIYLAYWDGTSVNELGKLPCPVIDKVTMREDWTPVLSDMSMRLEDRTATRTYTINPKQKFSFNFLADVIPDVRALFYIKGKRYICEKITATFTEKGMSRLLKGTFYQVVG